MQNSGGEVLAESPVNITLDILDGLATPGLVVSKDGGIITATNYSAASAIGMTRVELQGSRFKDISPDIALASIPVSAPAGRESGLDGEPASIQMPVGRWIGHGSQSVRVAMQAFPCGEIPALIVIGVPRNPLERFTELPHWLANVIDSLPALIAYVSLEDSPQVRYVNPAGLAMMGVESVEEALRRHATDPYIPGAGPWLPGEAIELVRQGQVWGDTGEVRNFHTGNVTPLARQVYPVYLRDSETVTAACIVGHDISSQVSDRWRSATLSSVVETLPASVSVFAPDDTLNTLYANRASLELSGVSTVEEMTGHLQVQKDQNEAIRHFVSNVIPRVLKGEYVEYQSEIRNFSTDQTLLVQRLVFPVYEGDRDTISAIGSISIDIEALADRIKQAESRLAEQGVLMEAVQGMYGNEKRRAEYLEKVQTIASHAASLLDVDAMLAYVARSMRESFGYHLVTIHTVDPDTNEVVLKAFSGPGESGRSAMSSQQPVAPNSVISWVASTGNELLIDNIEESGYEPVEGWPDTRSQLVIPIVFSKRVVGVLGVHSRRPAQFNDRDRSAVSILVGQIAVNLENARLLELARQQALLEERARIAKEMHDSLVQQLSSVHWQISALKVRCDAEGFRAEDAETVSQISRLVQEALVEARRSVWDLRPSEPKKQSLAEAIEQLLGQARQNSGLDAQFYCNGSVPIELSAAQDVFLGVCEQAINNVIDHASASRLTVSLDVAEQKVTLTITDDGEGFDSTHLPQPTTKSGHGLASMRNRVRLIGGDLIVSSTPGQGTEIKLTVPVTNEEKVDEQSDPNRDS